MRSLDDIYLFMRVVDHGGVSAASRALRMPKSTLTRRIAALEERLGSPLFHRGPQGLTLTNFGQECRLRSTRIVEDADSIFDFVDRRQEQPGGFLHIIYPSTIGASLIEPIAANFVRTHPQVRVHLEASTELIDPRSVSADLVFHFTFEPLPNADFIARKLYVNPFVLVAHPHVLQGRRLPQEPQALQGLPCLGYGPKSTTSSWRLQKRDRTYTHSFEPALSTFQLSALVTAVRRAAGVASVALNIVDEEIKQGHLLRMLPDWTTPPAVLYAIYPGRRSLTTAAVQFMEILQEYLSSRNTLDPYKPLAATADELRQDGDLG